MNVLTGYLDFCFLRAVLFVPHRVQQVPVPRGRVATLEFGDEGKSARATRKQPNAMEMEEYW